MSIWSKRSGEPARRRVLWCPLLLSVVASTVLTVALSVAR